MRRGKGEEDQREGRGRKLLLLTDSRKNALWNFAAIKASITPSDHPVVREGLIGAIPRQTICTEPRIIYLRIENTGFAKRIGEISSMENLLL